MNSLFSFAKSDQIKYLVYNDFGMNDILRTFIYNGNEDEQEISFKLLYQLSFDDKVAKDILNDTKIFEIIKNKSIKSKNCNGISWLINNKFSQLQPVSSSSFSSSSRNKKSLRHTYRILNIKCIFIYTLKPTNKG